VSAARILGCPERPELDALVRKSVDAFNALSPEQQAAHRREQRRSWVRGELMLSHPEMTFARANELIDQAEKPLLVSRRVPIFDSAS